MKQNKAVLLVIGCALLLSACAAPGGEGQTGPGSEPAQSGSRSAESQAGNAAASTEDAYHKITADEAKEMMDGGGVAIVDVRRPEEYGRGHIPGAVLVPNETIGTEQPEALPDKEAALIVYCRTGVRSKQASDKLVKMGYQNIYDMGGIVDWPYETESGNPQSEASSLPR